MISKMETGFRKKIMLQRDIRFNLIEPRLRNAG